MALNQTNKLVWIVETIYKARKITFEDLNRQWMDNVDLSGGEELLKRTFHKWKWNIFDTFGLLIECEKAAPYRYYIDNVDDMRRGSIESWLLSTYSVSNSLAENKSIKDRILLEDVPSGREYLDPILEAMKKNRFIHIAYYNYWREDLREHYIMPLCVKLFRQRWYVVGRQWPSGNDSIYCLDRIRDFRLSSHSFEYPKDFIPQEYFAGCFGIIADKDCDIQKVRLKVGSGQANYLRDLPLHESQQETERAEEYSIFEYRLRPTFDFQQEILWNGEDMEVLEPLWLHKEIARKIKDSFTKKYTQNTKSLLMYSQMKKVTLQKIDAENVRKKIFIGDDSMALVKHDYPILEYDTASKAIFQPGNGKKHFPKKAVFAFLGDEVEKYAHAHSGIQIDEFESATKLYPIYECFHNQERICLCPAPVGSAAAVQILEYLIAGGVTEIISVGSCGVLEDIPENRFLIPVSALRDEGTSYHYLPPSRDIKISTAGISAIKFALNQKKIPYLEVKTWTTDGFYRETLEMVQYRKEEGCQVVEMECSALAACAEFREVIWAMLLFTADTLSNPHKYQERKWGKASVSTALELAFDAVVLIKE